ncbi:hypothetical protein EV191_10774 [Tamaricihabitans halophyticus]|uniref:Uncharacterized protein n=1 Tax=Tamaricihabitans halophyticus TaxID=1262583 RepID=A0A4R2QMM7_9PSEU|nr:hypothetical protein EV191_10774 [Tamaricihabitans halophyticus]
MPEQTRDYPQPLGAGFDYAEMHALCEGGIQ